MVGDIPQKHNIQIHDFVSQGCSTWNEGGHKYVLPEAETFYFFFFCSRIRTN